MNFTVTAKLGISCPLYHLTPGPTDFRAIRSTAMAITSKILGGHSGFEPGHPSHATWYNSVIFSTFEKKERKRK